MDDFLTLKGAAQINCEILHKHPQAVKKFKFLPKKKKSIIVT